MPATRVSWLFAAALGAAAAFAMPLLSPAAWWALVALVVAGVIIGWRRDQLAQWGSVLVVAGLACAHGQVARARYVHSTHMPRELLVWEGVIDDVQPRPHSTTLRVEMTGTIAADGAMAALPVALMTEVSLVEGAQLDGRIDDWLPGTKLRVRGRMHAPLPALQAGAFDGERMALARGFVGRMSVSDPTQIEAWTDDHKASIARVVGLAQRALRARIAQHLPPQAGAVLLALMVGDTAQLDDEHRLAYRRVGAGHLLAVSGMQVTLLAMLVLRVLQALWMITPWGRRSMAPWMPTLCAAVAVLCFVWLCGAPPSAVRAALMAWVVLVAQQAGRKVALMDVLSVAGTLTLLVSPTTIFDAGFLLSYGALLGLLSSAPTFSNHGTLWAKLRPVVITSIGAALLTLPISAWLFGEVAWVGMFSNIVLVPVASALQLPALVGGFVGLLFPPLLWVAAQSALLLDALVMGMAALAPPIRMIETPSWWMCAALMAGAMIVSAWMAHGHWVRVSTAVVASTLAVIAVGFGQHPSHAVRVTFLPVGQGDATLIEFPQGKTMLVDGGGQIPMGGAGEGVRDELDPGMRVVRPYLRRRGIDHLDVVVMSHAHPDHALGLHALTRTSADGSPPIGVREFWYAPREGEPVHGYAAPLIAHAQQTRTTPDLLGVHPFGEAFVEVLAPAPGDSSSSYEEFGANDNSLVLRICLSDTCVLLPGDIESFGEEQLVAQHASRLRSTVVKAPHHGSRTSSAAPFIKATGAPVVVYCTGHNNLFGFPHDVVVDRWHEAGAMAYNTAREGQVDVWLRATGADVMPYRSQAIDASRLTPGATFP
jgi:competence protein ComEC